MHDLEQAGDAQLCAAHVAGDRRAFAALYDRHSRWCFARVSRLVRNDADAEEVQQEVWVTLARNLGTYEPTAQFRTYLNAIIRSRASDHWRRLSRRPVTNDLGDEDAEFDTAAADAPLPDSVAQSNEAVAAFSAALAGLSTDEQAVFRLKEGLDRGADMTWQDIAETLAIPLETARTRYRRVCAKLKLAMREHMDLS
ncbi:sigma-70 family RNA polymerase sigma factor [Sandarakinorhabdus sp.]|uniref:sigma-70 family RNA polymerase sigma factor n=1 Tax=Sandarakinorhabdus sp. TaxID=1916663 RepID=UPI0033416FA5